MERFRQVFKNRHVVLPVVHVKDLKQTIANVAVAQQAGADGVFLTNHEIPCEKLLDIYQNILAKFPHFWAGVNILGVDAFDVFNRIFKERLSVKGVWTDDARIFESKDDQYEAERIRQIILVNGWEGLHFGEVTLKYKDDSDEAAWISSLYVDVVTMNGGTSGQAPGVGKIRRTRQAIPGKPLAVAKGITPDSVGDCLEADCLLAGKGISKNPYTLDEKKTKRLVEKIRQQSS